MVKLSNDKKRQLAERFYITDGLPDHQVCELADIKQKTLWTWKKGRKGELPWGERRQLVISAPHKIKELILEDMERVANGEKPKINADTLVKMSKTLETIDKGVNVQTVISVLKEFDNWLSETNPELASKAVDFHKKFIHFKAASNG